MGAPQRAAASHRDHDVRLDPFGPAGAAEAERRTLPEAAKRSGREVILGRLPQYFAGRSQFATHARLNSNKMKRQWHHLSSLETVRIEACQARKRLEMACLADRFPKKNPNIAFFGWYTSDK
jgi:hypothetical protein